MRTLVRCCLLLALFAAAPPRTAHAQGAPRQDAAPAVLPDSEALPVLFGLRWGDPVLPGMVKTPSSPPGAQMYVRSDDKLELAGVPVESVLYVYENNRLAGFSIPVAANRKDALVAVLKKLWGEPQSQGNALFWFTTATMATLRELPGGTRVNLNVYENRVKAPPPLPPPR